MDTGGQFAQFGLCIVVGFLGGIIYDVFAFVRLLFSCGRGKCKVVEIANDVAFWLTFAVLAVACAYKFYFSTFRTYTWLGYILGGIIYSKSLHKIIAFFEIMWYNGIKKLINKARNQEKTLIK